MTFKPKGRKFFWIDMEMTGLDPETCRILEVAAVVTDLNLKPIDEFHAIVRQPKRYLDTMDAWCTRTHGRSGLTREVGKGKPLKDVEARLVRLARKHFPKGKIVLCGNSVSQDRKFIDRYLPKLARLLHYRIIDVTSFKEVFRSKYGMELEKSDAHRARQDIFESIAELAYYLNFIRVK
ncbi:MAG: oligoribonuclease [Pseudomonadota bacterium]